MNVKLLFFQKVIFFYLLIFSINIFSQSRLIDRGTNKPIPNTLIYNTKNQIIAISNKNGIFKVNEDSIKIKNVIYGDTTIKVKKKIYLTEKIYNLPVAEIKDTLPIMLRLKKALINSENILPKDTTLYYSFEINTEIKQLNWQEKAIGVFKVDIDKNNKVKIYICDNYKYEKDSIYFRIYLKLSTTKIKDIFFNLYKKDYEKKYKKIKEKIKHNHYTLIETIQNDTFNISFNNEKGNINYKFNKYIYSITNNYKQEKLLYIIKGNFNSVNTYKLIKNKIFIMNNLTTVNYSILHKNNIYDVYSTINIRKKETYSCKKYYIFKDGLHNKYIFSHLKDANTKKTP